MSADPRRVWGVLADIEGWATWNPAIREVSLDGDLEIGAHFRWATGPGTITSRLTFVDAPTRLAWQGSFMTLHHQQSWQIEARDGGCVVTAQEAMTGLLSRLFSRRLRRTRQQGLDAWLALLKLEAEARSEDATEDVAEPVEDETKAPGTRTAASPLTTPRERPSLPPEAAS